MSNILTNRTVLIILGSLLTASAFVVGLAWNDVALKALPNVGGAVIYAVIITILYIIVSYYVGKYLPESFDKNQSGSTAKTIYNATHNKYNN